MLNSSDVVLCSTCEQLYKQFFCLDNWISKIVGLNMLHEESCPLGGGGGGGGGGGV